MKFGYQDKMGRGLSNRVLNMQPSATIAVAEKAGELKRQGVDILSFSLGEPDFATPANIRDAANLAMKRGETHYTAAKGIVELRQAICDESATRRKATFSPDQVVVSCGAKHTLFNLAMALYQEGDEVIVPAPYWVSYPEQVRFCGATPVIVESDESNGFRLNAAQLKSALSPKTKAIILCSPSNPTGAAYSKAELAALAAVLGQSDCYIIIDEIYAQLVYGEFEQMSLIDIAPELSDRIIIVDGVSKTYAMTGWRIGWMFAPLEVAKACSKIQSQSTSNPNSIAQFAAIEALRGPKDEIETMRNAFIERREVTISGLNAIDGIQCNSPEGAFYAFPNMSAFIGKSFDGKTIEHDIDLVTFLLEEAHCAFVPGSAFGAPGYMRMSYACDTSAIREGLRRVEEALKKLT